MGKKRILVVDDASMMRLFYREVLEMAGFDVEEAVNGVEGLERALMGTCDMMVVDINMPKMDGYELIREIRNEPKLQATPIVTVSTESETGDAEKAYDAGANFYMVKPPNPDQLVEAVELMTGVET